MAERRVFFNPMMSDAEIEFRIDKMIESGIAALADDLHARLTSTPIIIIIIYFAQRVQHT